MTGCRELRLDNQNREEGAPDVWPSTWMSRHDLARKAEICLQCGSTIFFRTGDGCLVKDSSPFFMG